MSALDLSVTLASLVGVFVRRTTAVWVVALLGSALAALAACDPGGPGAREGAAPAEARAACAPVSLEPAGAGTPAGDVHVASLPDSTFSALVARISEPGGFFDTDNLISNESGYLKVVGAMDRLGVRGGAYLGVGPDQNFSYIARVRPQVAFVMDIRRDNLLHHLLLKALMERSPTRIEFLAALHGKPAPDDPASWEGRSLDEIVVWVDGAPASPSLRAALLDEVERAVRGFGIPLEDADVATVRRFHGTFMDEGLDLRFTSFGRAPRPYYPTYRQLLLETDMGGAQASYLARAEDYAFVRSMQLANRVVPVVGDLAGPHAVREMGAVLREMGLTLSALYASNVEYYLWGDGVFPAWVANVASLPAAANAVVIRSYFPNEGPAHPSAVPGYWATQTLQPVTSLVAGGFASYWDVVTRDAVPLR
ncbi:MAG: hypothetical protein Q8N53_09715 [Longimicrobiales bacterium]|nr:hypothetical protein [Longimicrobiales bacterium]